MPKKKTDNKAKKTHFIGLRVDDTEWSLIKFMADEWGTSISEAVRKSAIDRILARIGDKKIKYDKAFEKARSEKDSKSKTV